MDYRFLPTSKRAAPMTNPLPLEFSATTELCTTYRVARRMQKEHTRLGKLQRGSSYTDVGLASPQVRHTE